MIETPIFVFVPDKNEIVKIEEGSGDNLLPEDEEEGFVDYVNIDSYIVGDEDPHAIDLWDIDAVLDLRDGGMMMLTEYFGDAFKSEKQLIDSCIEYQYDRLLKWEKLDNDIDESKKLFNAICDGKDVREAISESINNGGK